MSDINSMSRESALVNDRRNSLPCTINTDNGRESKGWYIREFIIFSGIREHQFVREGEGIIGFAEI